MINLIGYDEPYFVRMPPDLDKGVGSSSHDCLLILSKQIRMQKCKLRTKHSDSVGRVRPSV